VHSITNIAQLRILGDWKVFYKEYEIIEGGVLSIGSICKCNIIWLLCRFSAAKPRYCWFWADWHFGCVSRNYCDRSHWMWYPDTESGVGWWESRGLVSRCQLGLGKRVYCYVHVGVAIPHHLFSAFYDTCFHAVYEASEVVVETCCSFSLTR
jgi:hypothetical protein